jgi:hypothetical protein
MVVWIWKWKKIWVSTSLKCFFWKIIGSGLWKWTFVHPFLVNVMCIYLRNDHDNRWLPRKNLLAIILHVKHVFAPRYGHVYSIEFHGGVMFATYEKTVGVIPNCTCPDFMSMLTSLKKKKENLSLENMCFIYKIKMLCDHKIDDFIN